MDAAMLPSMREQARGEPRFDSHTGYRNTASVRKGRRAVDERHYAANRSSVSQDGSSAVATASELAAAVVGNMIDAAPDGHG